MDLARRKFLSKAATYSASLLATGLMVNTVSASASATNDIRLFIRDHGNFSISGIRLRNREALERLYADRAYQPLWTAEHFPTHTSVVISQRLADAQLQGLEPSKYYGKLLNQLAVNSRQDNSLQFEVLMSDSIISFFDDIAHGTTEPPSSATGWRLKREQINVADITNDFFRGVKSLNETVNELQPQHHRYTRLLEAYQHHQAIADNGGWQQIGSGPSLGLGDENVGVEVLRRRLLTSGDLRYTMPADPNHFDTELAEALIRFQNRHGLEPDGVMGPKTRNTLNVPVETRLAQLQLNLDRWRWLQRDFGYSNITVNTAGFEMEVTLSGTIAMNMNVIVGQPKYATPLFSDSMEHMVFKPSWYVPSSIAKKLLKEEANRPGLLQSDNFEVIEKSTNSSVSFSQLTRFERDPEFFSTKYRLRQLPGKNNALGNLKFMFPNKYAIYLHDTPSKKLFAKSERAFSHGCIRLEKPTELAQMLLAADGHSSAEIDVYQMAASTKKVNFRTPLPVHLTYQTVWVDDFGVTHFREDIYNHDKHGIAQLENNRATYVNAESSAIALTNITLASNLY